MVGKSVGIDPPSKSGRKARGTKLVLRTSPPKGDAETYGEDSKGKFLGFCVGRLSVPRWMSGHFPAATKEGVDLDKYSDDWVEKIVYVKTTEKPSSKEKAVINLLVSTIPALTHTLDCGCGCSGPMTEIQAIIVQPDGTVKLAPADKKLYFSTVSAFDPDEPKEIVEWTITSQANRHKFETSKLQENMRERCSVHKKHKDPERSAHFTTLRNLPDDFKP